MYNRSHDSSTEQLLGADRAAVEASMPTSILVENPSTVDASGAWEIVCTPTIFATVCLAGVIIFCCYYCSVFSIPISITITIVIITIVMIIIVFIPVLVVVEAVVVAAVFLCEM
jgi:hypothetical protein